MTPSPRGRAARQRRGVALVMVLALVALVLILVLAVLEISSTQAQRGSIAADGAEAETLARLPADLIIAQLARATTQTTTAEGERLLWASQPGMIRTFGSQVKPEETKPGTVMHYRLYSAPVLNTPGFDTAAEATATEHWASLAAGYTDLNEPALSRSGREARELRYPIADPATLGVTDGYALRLERPPGASNAHPLPLPVAWIYVLKDGRFLLPQSLNGDSAGFDATQVTQENPIVGRIAFWTDDESCKLNLNTASEAEPWDMPAGNTLTEQGYAARVPGEVEHHRMSAHPAYTSLSVVMKHFSGGHPGVVQWPPAEPFNPFDSESSAWWQRYVGCYQAMMPHGVLAPTQPEGTLLVKQERHFASVNEFYYSPMRTRSALSTGFAMQAGDLQRTHFLLTTRSSAPELNPFGQPKIALWPMAHDSSTRSLLDRRISQSAKLNASLAPEEHHEFVFQRASNWESPSSQGSSQSASADLAQVPRNRELYAWLQRLSSEEIPGYGGSFAGKYGKHSRDQILTSMFDMLRWGANTKAYLPPSVGGQSEQGLAEQSAVPLSIEAPDGKPYTRGFGRFPTITEVAIVFAFTDVERGPDGLPRDDNQDGICDRAAKLRVFMVVNPFLVSSGPPAVSPAWSVRIRQMQHLTLGQGIGLALPGGNMRNRCFFSGGQPLPGGLRWDGHTSAYASFASQFLQPNGTAKTLGKRNGLSSDFPFISNADINLPAANGRPDTTIRFSGGTITVDLMEQNAPLTSPRPNDAIHSVQMEFPETQLPMPSLRVADFSSGPRKMDSRFNPVLIDGVATMQVIKPDDIVRSLILNPNGPSRGDARLLAGSREQMFVNDFENADWFVAHPDYHSRTVPIAHTLRATTTTAPSGAGALLANLNYVSIAKPAVPLGLLGAVVPATANDPGNRLGDWESGTGFLEDGPLVNRSHLAPEGSFSHGSVTSYAGSLTQMASAVSFGAIPSGAYGDTQSTAPRPWQTLLFCPNPAGRTSPADQPGHYDATAHDHFGFKSPPDHLWLEYFWRPIVEPWPMSTGFATEGKVNMNFQILPWTWLRRSSAMHGALHGVRITAIPSQAMAHDQVSAKGRPDCSPIDKTFRYAVNADKTLAAFEQRFDTGEVFRTPSEICEMFLVPRRIVGHRYVTEGFAAADPANPKVKDLTEWWTGSANDVTDAFEATGDNLRESPYAQLYPRLCTQSNVYRVHYRVQVLRKSRGTRAEEWVESRDHVQSERRGSYLIERRLDSGSTPLPDPATDESAPSLHGRQTFSIVSHEGFTP